MKQQDEDMKKLIGKFIVAISKDFDTREDAAQLRNFGCPVKIAKMNNDKFVVVRQLTDEDTKSMDFMKYVASFDYKSISRLETPRWK